MVRLMLTVPQLGSDENVCALGATRNALSERSAYLRLVLTKNTQAECVSGWTDDGCGRCAEISKDCGELSYMLWQGGGQTP